MPLLEIKLSLSTNHNENTRDETMPSFTDPWMVNKEK